MKLNDIIRDFFIFTKAERRGLTVIVLLMCVFLIAGRLIFLLERPAVVDRMMFENLAKEFEQHQSAYKSRWSFFSFDPNTIDSLALDSLRLPLGVKRNIIRYRQHGGVFRNQEDLRRIYGMTDSVYEEIKDYINIDDVKNQSIVKTVTPVRSSPARGVIKPAMTGDTARVLSERSGYDRGLLVKYSGDTARVLAERQEAMQTTQPLEIEINSATVSDFKRLYGIGEILSVRIVKYRELLGGFASLDQLGEVYGMKEETAENIKEHLTLNPDNIIKMDLNFAKTEELARHPYLGREGAMRITEYRNRKGFIADKSRLLVDSVLSPRTYTQINPYLKTTGD